MSTNPYTAGVFYTGSFITQQFVPTFTELLADERVAILAEINAAPDVSVLVLKHTYIFPNLDDLSLTHGFYYINSGGTIEVSGAIPTFTGKTTTYVNSAQPPTVLVFTDENGDFRYVSANQQTLVLSASGTKNTGFRSDLFQFVGEFLEMVGEDGESIYRISVDSGDNINVTLNRTESQRNAPIRISNGHPFAYDGTYLWLEGLVSLGDIETRVEETETGFGGVAVPLVSTLSIQLADGEFDYLVNQKWDTRDIEIKAGLTTDPIGEYRVILRGKSERAEWDYNLLRISLRDQGILFDRNVQTNTYAGTGVYEGTEDIAGRVKPLGYGFVRQATPVLLDANLNLYQVHDGPIHLFGDIAQGAVYLIRLQEDDALEFWLPTEADVDAGGYRTDHNRGMFRLAAPPGGPVTVNFNGDRNIPFNSTQGDIVRAIAQRVIPEADIDQDAFDRHNDVVQPLFGLYLKEQVTVRDTYRQLCASNGDFVAISRLNTLRIRHLHRNDSVAIITENDIIDDDFVHRRRPPRPGRTYRMGYQRSNTVLNEGDFLGAADSYLRQFLVSEWRWIEFNPMPGESKYDSSKTVELHMLTDGPPYDHIVEAAFRDHILSDLYSITVHGYSFGIEVGDTVLLQLDRWDINFPKTMIVVGVIEMSPTDNTEDRTRLLLWG